MRFFLVHAYVMSHLAVASGTHEGKYSLEDVSCINEDLPFRDPQGEEDAPTFPNHTRHLPYSKYCMPEAMTNHNLSAMP